ncbi:hypothetical protein DLJ53_10070 [Acuticoccus sediminis]|uniref:TRAP transporter small permease protein n=1 Tax=Acuticoccus sediminis TaxID=2184697 RepID=A0A8B2NW41_9HYPH|nr:TRAP transporter small permease [Acuticoccus sediminis]RAI01744.1 hypothetical protein DLJ53_10070 [Acuticoccus sediminis]
MNAPSRFSATSPPEPEDTPSAGGAPALAPADSRSCAAPKDAAAPPSPEGVTAGTVTAGTDPANAATPGSVVPRPPLGMALDRALADLAGAMLLAMMVMTVGSSLGRFLFSAPIPDMEAIAEMLLVAVVFLPLAYTQARREHVEVTLFTDPFPLRLRRVVIVAGWLVGLFGFAVLAYAMAKGALRAHATGDAYLGVNKILTWPARAVAVVGLVALLLRLGVDLATRRREAAETAAQTADDIEYAQ